MPPAAPRSRFPRRRALAAACVLGALTVAGCGEDEEPAREPRPPLPVTVTALVDERSVSVTPPRLGAGLVRIVVANQSSEPQTVGLRADSEERAPVTRRTDPIAVGGTGALKVDLEPGTYRLATGSDGIADGVLEVGRRRSGVHDQILVP